MVDKVLKYKARIVVGIKSTLRRKLVNAMHDFYIGGHDGIQNTYKRLKTAFYWSTMKSTVKQVMERYVVCKQAKVGRVAYLGLFQPLLVPKRA